MKRKNIKPILFNTDMVNSIIKGIKTQTRRTKGLKNITNEFSFLSFSKDRKYATFSNKTNKNLILKTVSVPFNIGDILWVRETFRLSDFPKQEGLFEYKADLDNPFATYNKGIWKPSIHMPKNAARLFLKVTNIRIEKLNEITENEAKKEGVKYDIDFNGFNCYLCDNKGHVEVNLICENGFYDNAFESFRSLWKAINGIDSWNHNPYVWVIDFEPSVKNPFKF